MRQLLQNRRIVPATLAVMLGTGMMCVAVSYIASPISDIYWFAGGIGLASFAAMLMMTYLPWSTIALVFVLAGFGTLVSGIVSSTWTLGFVAAAFVMATIAVAKVCYNS